MHGAALRHTNYNLQPYIGVARRRSVASHRALAAASMCAHTHASQRHTYTKCGQNSIIFCSPVTSADSNTNTLSLSLGCSQFSNLKPQESRISMCRIKCLIVCKTYICRYVCILRWQSGRTCAPCLVPKNLLQSEMFFPSFRLSAILCMLANEMAKKLFGWFCGCPKNPFSDCIQLPNSHFCSSKVFSNLSHIKETNVNRRPL